MSLLISFALQVLRQLRVENRFNEYECGKYKERLLSNDIALLRVFLEFQSNNNGVTFVDNLRRLIGSSSSTTSTTPSTTTTSTTSTKPVVSSTDDDDNDDKVNKDGDADEEDDYGYDGRPPARRFPRPTTKISICLVTKKFSMTRLISLMT